MQGPRQCGRRCSTCFHSFRWTDATRTCGLSIEPRRVCRVFAACLLRGEAQIERLKVQGLRVLLLGQGRLELDGQALTRLLAPKQQALLFYLAAVGGSVARTKLAAMLWSELDEASARSNLRGALSRLRRWLPELLLVDAQQIGLAPGAAWEVDLHALTQAMSSPGMEP